MSNVKFVMLVVYCMQCNRALTVYDIAGETDWISRSITAKHICDAINTFMYTKVIAKKNLEKLRLEVRLLIKYVQH